MASPVTPLLIAGGVGVALVKAAEESAAAPVEKRTPSQMFRDQPHVQRYRVSAAQQAGTWDPTFSGSEAPPQELQDKLMEQLKNKWDDMNSDARKKACQALKNQHPTNEEVQAFPCSEDWSDIAAMAGAALGAAGGAAVCGPPCGYIGGVLGAAIGTAIGEKLDDMLSDAWSGLESAGEAVTDWVGGILNF